MFGHQPEFQDRREAGRRLAAALSHFAPTHPLVLALPRGGVPVAAEVARALGAPLDLLLVRKIGVPWNPELAVAALVDGDPPELVIDEAMRRLTGVSRDDIEMAATLARTEIERRRQLYVGARAPLTVQGSTVIVVDDGVATGATVRAALQALRRRAPARLVLAVPVAPPDTARALAAEVDELVCLAEPEPFEAVGRHYRDFHQVSDAEVLAALHAAAPDAAH